MARGRSPWTLVGSEAVTDPTNQKTQSFAWSAGPLGARLTILWEGGTAVREIAEGTSFVIGRAIECDLHVLHPSLSRKHVAVHVGAALTVEDLGSSNGTRVAGRPIPPHVRVGVEHGAVIEAGAVVIVMQRHGGASSPETSGASKTPALDAERLTQLVANSELSTLLVGETGVGKELMAERIHRGSRRASGPFMRLNCAALTETLLESELFGHERGSFTGAVASKVGLFEAAAGGTVFLDEVGEMPLSTQAKLLRVLENREVLRVGGLEPRPIDVRFVAATNRELPRLVEEGAFRRDLYFRLNGITLTIPPLRERPEAIMPLAREFVARATPKGMSAPRFTPAAEAALRAHTWPGNIRELKNTVERAVVLSQGETIGREHLLVEAPYRPMAPPAPASPSVPAAPDRGDALRTEVADFERAKIVAALEQAGGHQGRAADILGISRRTLVSRLSAYGLTKRRGP